jgi:hypothetical protein
MLNINENVTILRERIEEKRNELENTQLRSIKSLITKEQIERICDEQKYVYRERKLSPVITILHMIGAALSRERSFQSAWHNSGQRKGSDILSKARKRLPLGIWDRLDKLMNQNIDNEFGASTQWRGHRVIGIDGTGVSMSDEQELCERYGKAGSKHGISRFPTGRMIYAFTLATHITIAHEIEHYRQSEQALLRKIMSRMRSNDVIICDRHFAGANLYVEYQRSGLHFITRKQQRLDVTRLKKATEYSPKDFIVEMPLIAKHRREDTTLPASIAVRMIEVAVSIRGKTQTLWLATSLLDAAQYPAKEITALYKKRWEVETLIEEQKIWLGSDVLRSKTSAGIKKELFARIITGNLIHWLILKASEKYNVDPTRISITAATRLIHYYSIRMSEASCARLPYLYDQLLFTIAESIVPYRPNRSEPRAKRRDQKHYSILHVSRSQWRRENILS